MVPLSAYLPKGAPYLTAIITTTTMQEAALGVGVDYWPPYPPPLGLGEDPVLNDFF